ncbi:MAG: ribonuclease HII [Candidatus Paceibacterota bacterium]
MRQNIKYLIGIDEVGRGPLAGPVCVCSTIIPRNFKMSIFSGVKDSKKLSAKKREEWFEKIKELKKKGLVDYKIAFVSNSEIDKIGITKSIQKAINNCLKSINPKTCKVLLDGGIKAPEKFLNQKTIIKGDEKEKVIALASIIAKVSRDKVMCEFAKKYPQYRFDKHKGYGTALHIKKIKKHGPCKIHRKTYIKNI